MAEEWVPTSTDALLLAAPHPDDELISSGLLIQRALEAGARLLVVVLTHGDAFGYATGGPVGRGWTSRRTKALGVARQEETVRVLLHLGAAREQITFLGYPDRGLAAMWSEHWSLQEAFRSPFTFRHTSPYQETHTPMAVYAGEQLLADLKEILNSFQPTACVYPHPRDAHGDHWAASAFLTCALEESALAGADWAPRCRRLYYLVHRGGWPVPRGLNSHLPLSAPPAIVRLGETWVEVRGGEHEVSLKHAAALMYRTQVPFVGRFLLSFVRQNEIFATGRFPSARRVKQGEILIGGDGQAWPESALIPDPVGDSVTRQVERAGDIVSVDIAGDGRVIYVKVELLGRAASDVEYRLLFYDCPRAGRVSLRLKPPYRVTRKIGGKWRLTRDVVARPCGNVVEAGIPGFVLGYPKRLFVSVETRSRRIAVDRSGIHFVTIPPWRRDGAAVMYATATPGDLPACSKLFTEAFEDSLLHVFGRIPSPRLIHQVFRLCYDAEPRALLVAKSGGNVVGYVYAPSSLRHIWWTALRRGHLFRWVASWVKGRFDDLGLAPLRVMLLDKFHFLRSSVGGELSVEARILSIAVSSDERGSGIGTHLVRQALQRFRMRGVTHVRLEVRPWNEPAVCVYNKMGFRVHGTTHDSRGDWLIMLLDLEANLS